MSIETSWVISTNDLENRLNEKPLSKDLLIIDMTKESDYQEAHIPGAIFLDYAKIVKHAPPVVGMLPDPQQFSETLSNLGISPESYIVAYDDEGGGKAARFMWTMEIAGHKKMSLLDGGIHAWLSDKKPLSNKTPDIKQSQYPVSFNDLTTVADADYIMAHLNQPNFCVLDTRSESEFTGADKRAARAGHIPGAINLDWQEIKNNKDAQRLKPTEELKKMLTGLGLSQEQEIVTYCHSHHRSALMYIALKSLGYPNIKGYPASWSDWAVRDDKPVEI
ncbi:MAG: sulfurtransferase [Gammaproteobacteria bacterium]|nr:sulfurtransferase [Gammaproteobacteria bacterium]